VIPGFKLQGFRGFFGLFGGNSRPQGGNWPGSSSVGERGANPSPVPPWTNSPSVSHYPVQATSSSPTPQDWRDRRLIWNCHPSARASIENTSVFSPSTTPTNPDLFNENPFPSRAGDAQTLPSGLLSIFNSKLGGAKLHRPSPKAQASPGLDWNRQLLILVAKAFIDRKTAGGPQVQIVK